MFTNTDLGWGSSVSGLVMDDFGGPIALQGSGRLFCAVSHYSGQISSMSRKAKIAIVI